MKDMTVRDVLCVTSGQLLSGDASARLLSVSTDSREKKESCLFVPIVGENTDAHRFIGQALENGCVASLTADPSYAEAYLASHPGEDPAFVLVRDTTDAIQRIAKEARNRLALPAVGVTGSVGKTTTREMIAAALGAGKKVYKTDKNYNNWLGVPLTLCEMSDDYDIAVLELGLNVPGELGLISGLSGIETAVITNIGLAHMEYYGSQDLLAREKYTITNGFRDDGKPKMLFLNADDTMTMKYRDSTGYPYTLYGTVAQADYRVADVRTHPEGSTYTLYVRGEERLTGRLSVPGFHTVLNAAAALAVADYYGVDLERAAEALSRFKGYKGRLAQHRVRGCLLIDDAYNASPSSMRAGLSVLKDMVFADGKGRKIAVLGDMLEMGPDSPKYHFEIGQFAADLPIDRFLLVGKEAQEIRRGLESRGRTETDWYPVPEDALPALLALIRPGDIIYFKASHGIHLERITEALIRES
ncbi:MAG: UDP-N-acetylmuramoyl-tripeptide--D-alanyl-D-alanine ligase [Lachnospiraceae bacterium]|nr:UDP-N-acetylmuramoyl-tripeptide--D-alanyl-D-alanine ligase [Lachnospiraceae bacterium]